MVANRFSGRFFSRRRPGKHLTTMRLEIEANTRVTLNFSLSLETGEEVDTNFGQDPVTFVMGDGSLLPGFERRLLGMRPGDEAEFKIPRRRIRRTAGGQYSENATK